MKRILFGAVALTVILTLFGCGSSSPPPPPPHASILSSAANDGYIEVDTTGVPVQVAQGNTLASVFAGFDANSGHEFRAFLDFPLGGQDGQDVVPANAIIDSATLDIFIDNLTPLSLSSVPIFIDLLPPPTRNPLLVGDFTAPFVVSKTSDVAQIDVGHHRLIDVTQLMVQAQLGAFPHFQLRIQQDPAAPDGLVQIHEATTARAPLLTVFYH